MACSIQRPSPQALFDRYRNMFSVTVLGGSPVVPESNEWYVTSLNYAMAEEFYAISEQAWKERDPRYACCDNLIKLAEADGIYPRAATQAEGYIKVTGTAGATLPDRLEVLIGDSNYQTVGVLPDEVPSTGTFVARVRALEPGTKGNGNGTTTTGTLASGVAGVNRTVELCGATLCGGAEAEDCETFRRRYMDRKSYQPRATSAWLKEQLLAWPCATRVLERSGTCCGCGDPCIDPECQCEGCGDRLEFYVMFDNTFECGIPPENVVHDMNVWAFGERNGYGEGLLEIGVCGRIVQPVGVPVNVYIDIDGCPSASQQNQITADITALMRTVAPSQLLRAQQFELVVANIMGGDVNVQARVELVTPDPDAGTINHCGDYEPACDYLPCLNEVIYTRPDNGVGCS